MSGSNQEALKKIVSDFESKNEHIKIKLVFQGNYRELFDKLMAAAKGNTLPTMAQIYSNRPSWYVGKWDNMQFLLIKVKCYFATMKIC